MIKHPTLFISSRSGAGNLIYSKTTNPPIKALISIGSLDDRPCAGFMMFPTDRRLRLVFNDVNISEMDYSYDHPQKHHVEKLIQFAKDIKNIDGALLCHCYAGISRSTAASLITLTVWLGIENIDYACAYVKNARSQACPNDIMLRYADEILQLDGKLVSRRNL